MRTAVTGVTRTLRTEQRLLLVAAPRSEVMVPATDAEGATMAVVFEERQEVVVPEDRNVRLGGRGSYIVTGPSPRTTLYSMPSSTVVRR